MSITIVEADGQLRTITKEADFLIILEKLTIEKLKDVHRKAHPKA